MITRQWVPDEKVICSVMIKQYRLILYRDSLGYGYQLLDNGKNVQHYSAPDNRTAAITNMGNMMIEALLDYGVNDSALIDRVLEIIEGHAKETHPLNHGEKTLLSIIRKEILELKGGEHG